MSETFSKDFRRFFVKGLMVVLPTLLTITIVVWVFTMIQEYVGQYINVVAKWFVVQFRTVYDLATAHGLKPGPSPWWRVLTGPERHWRWVNEVWGACHLGWVGFVLAFVVIYVLGRLVASFIGKGLWRMIERTFMAMPVVKQIYPSIKQVTDFLLSERKMEISRVVAVEYPRKGVWSLGLVTAPGMRTLQRAQEGEFLTIFVPSSPTPVTGYTIMVRRDEVIDLPIHIDDALRFVISGGVIMPPSELPSALEIEQARLAALPPATQGKENQE